MTQVRYGSFPLVGELRSGLNGGLPPVENDVTGIGKVMPRIVSASRTASLEKSSAAACAGVNGVSCAAGPPAISTDSKVKASGAAAGL